VLKQEFAAILLDVRLPNMDGFEVAAAIRSLERLRRTPILFMSANEDRRRKPRPSAHEHYFRKPLAPGAVRAKVASFLPLAPAVVDAQQPRAQDRVS
jgi:CheY-like chemotaxis protein